MKIRLDRTPYLGIGKFGIRIAFNHSLGDVNLYGSFFLYKNGRLHYHFNFFDCKPLDEHFSKLNISVEKFLNLIFDRYPEMNITMGPRRKGEILIPLLFFGDMKEYDLEEFPYELYTNLTYEEKMEIFGSI